MVGDEDDRRRQLVEVLAPGHVEARVPAHERPEAELQDRLAGDPRRRGSAPTARPCCAIWRRTSAPRCAALRPSSEPLAAAVVRSSPPLAAADVRSSPPLAAADVAAAPRPGRRRRCRSSSARAAAAARSSPCARALVARARARSSVPPYRHLLRCARVVSRRAAARVGATASPAPRPSSAGGLPTRPAVDALGRRRSGEELQRRRPARPRPAPRRARAPSRRAPGAGARLAARLAERARDPGALDDRGSRPEAALAAAGGQRRRATRS